MRLRNWQGRSVSKQKPIAPIEHLEQPLAPPKPVGHQTRPSMDRRMLGLHAKTDKLGNERQVRRIAGKSQSELFN